MTLSIFPYNPHSEGAAALAAALGIRRIRHEGSRYRGRPGKYVINWGASRLPDNVAGATIINKPEAVARVSNKLLFFQACAWAGTPRIPEFTTDRNVVRGWLGDGSKVVARTILQGHSGLGIVILEGAGVDIPAAPLYTKYIPKKEEWRIHVYRDGDQLHVLDQQRKIRDPAYEGVPDWNVRSHANGFIFAREVAPPNPDVLQQAILALQATDLDFGAVDVVWNQQNGMAYVLEVNSAPGLAGQTITSYANVFRRFL